MNILVWKSNGCINVFRADDVQEILDILGQIESIVSDWVEIIPDVKKSRDLILKYLETTEDDSSTQSKKLRQTISRLVNNDIGVSYDNEAFEHFRFGVLK